jgi:sialidase-1
MIKKYSISNDPEQYEAFPDLVLTTSGTLITVFTECAHHGDRSYTRIVRCSSEDRGRTWSPKQAVTEGTRNQYSYDCARIGRLNDNRLYILVNKLPHNKGGKLDHADAETLISFSTDDGITWSDFVTTPVRGIVPDKITETASGRWLIGAHYEDPDDLCQYLWHSDDKGKSWSSRVTVGKADNLNLCEVSILPCKNGTLVAFMRENSSLGLDCMKAISNDDGETWSPLIKFPLPGCHRPVAGYLQDGSIMITHRFMQGGKGWLGYWTQNFFAAFTDEASVLATDRQESSVRIMPIDYDRSPNSDLGYSGWVQFPDGEIYVVNYIVDDAIDKGQIRGYSFHMKDVILPS